MQNASENILKKGEIFTYPNQVYSQNSQEIVLNACNPKEFNKTDLDLTEMSLALKNHSKQNFLKCTTSQEITYY